MIRLLIAAMMVVPAQGQEASVEANDQLKFSPETINVPVGGTVTWTNVGGIFHTVTGDANASMINGQIPAKGSTYKVTFDKAGTFNYVCTPHAGSGMKGTVVVGEAAATSSPSPAAASPTPSPAESVEPSHQLEEIEAERASQERTLGGFRAFTFAATAALIALCIALVASTRPRRR